MLDDSLDFSLHLFIYFNFFKISEAAFYADRKKSSYTTEHFEPQNIQVSVIIQQLSDSLSSCVSVASEINE